MLDAAANNSYTLIKKSGSYSKSKKACLKDLTFQFSETGVKACLRLSNQKHAVRQAAVQMFFFLPLNPALGMVPHPAIKQDAEFTRNIHDYIVIIAESVPTA